MTGAFSSLVKLATASLASLLPFEGPYPFLVPLFTASMIESTADCGGGKFPNIVGSPF